MHISAAWKILVAGFIACIFVCSAAHAEKGTAAIQENQSEGSNAKAAPSTTTPSNTASQTASPGQATSQPQHTTQ